jgi:heme A synthase
MDTVQHNPWLSRYAKFIVVATLTLILLGCMVTTYCAGMAVATWPTIHGEMNPPGWWRNFPVFLEHSHRLLAIGIGVFVGILCAWVWGNFWALGVAAIVSGLSSALARMLSLDGNLAMQLRIWPAAVAFVVFLLFRHRFTWKKISCNQRFALVLFGCVCIQAVMGGYRVTLETDGNNAVKQAEALVAKASTAPSQEADALRKVADELGAKANALYPLATNLRVVHGCFAHFLLVLLVIFAARLSPVWTELSVHPHPRADKFRRMAVALLGLYFVQLACAAYLRHKGIGMLIPSWPSAQPGSLLPVAWSHEVVIHFIHTRILPVLIAGHVIGMAIGTAKRAAGFPRLTRVGWALLALVLVQFTLGVMVIWKTRQPHITNTHVVVGAAFCATAALYFARAGRLRATA